MEHNVTTGSKPEPYSVSKEGRAAIDEILCDMLLVAVLDDASKMEDSSHEQSQTIPFRPKSLRLRPPVLSGPGKGSSGKRQAAVPA